MAFDEHPGFKVLKDHGLKRPDGGKKRKSRRLRAGRSPVYIPVATVGAAEAARWLRR